MKSYKELLARQDDEWCWIDSQSLSRLWRECASEARKHCKRAGLKFIRVDSKGIRRVPSLDIVQAYVTYYYVTYSDPDKLERSVYTLTALFKPRPAKQEQTA